MQSDVRTRAPARQLPEVNPTQLSLPGVEPAPVTRRFLLPKSVRDSIAAVAVIGFLFMIGQGTVAGSLAAAVVLYRVNLAIDNAMGGKS